MWKMRSECHDQSQKNSKNKAKLKSLNAMQVEFGIREKTSMASMVLPEADGLDKQIQLCQVLHDEEHMRTDDPWNLDSIQAGAIPLQKTRSPCPRLKSTEKNLGDIFFHKA